MFHLGKTTSKDGAPRPSTALRSDQEKCLLLTSPFIEPGRPLMKIDVCCRSSGYPRFIQIMEIRSKTETGKWRATQPQLSLYIVLMKIEGNSKDNAEGNEIFKDDDRKEVIVMSRYLEPSERTV